MLTEQDRVNNMNRKGKKRGSTEKNTEKESSVSGRWLIRTKHHGLNIFSGENAFNYGLWTGKQKGKKKRMSKTRNAERYKREKVVLT